MQSKSQRIIFGYKNRNYKFVSFFTDKKDNSFYFHLYRRPGETPMEPKIPLHERGDSKIDFTSYHQTNFKENKISFHKSGYIHSTDNQGNRFKDGTIGIPFETIDSFLFILVLAPHNPTEMIKLDKIDSTRDVHIGLPDNIEPFAVHFAVYKRNTNPKPNVLHRIGRIIKCEYNNKDFGLLICLSKVLKATGIDKVNWPPFTLVLKRIS